MTRDEFINLLKDNVKPNAEMDFLLIGKINGEQNICVFLDITDIGMNIDVDDPNSKNNGGIVFNIKKNILE